ncbi:PROTEIN STAY-GREEN 1 CHLOROPLASTIC-RELATED [Salix koriyanagi]|uniref:PROTEIN STAY-GREEN 1 CHLOROPLASTIC-RELATED n=1 Tax=Salix koriyanagi TaxID=2511006 RepID=A0A9Q0P4V5_9ROSI|nr:PROTEIN STAY-GREEN 1 CHLOROPLASTIC-RELATED [Salix koriyanagi]
MACHCTRYSFSPSPLPHRQSLSINNSTMLSFTGSKPAVLPSHGSSRATSNTLVSEAVRLLGPPAKFEASKLKVVLMGEEMNQYSAIIPRTYILSHCDFTADLTLTISNVINLDQLRGWYSKDDVVAEWKKA